jgi:hypothetical protein
MQQGTSVMKNFAWCAVITPHHFKSGGMPSHRSRSRGEGRQLGSFGLRASSHRRNPEDTLAHTKTPPIASIAMYPVDTLPGPRYARASSASNHRSLPFCRR